MILIRLNKYLTIQQIIVFEYNLEYSNICFKVNSQVAIMRPLSHQRVQQARNDFIMLDHTQKILL